MPDMILIINNFIWGNSFAKVTDYILLLIMLRNLTQRHKRNLTLAYSRGEKY